MTGWEIILGFILVFGSWSVGRALEKSRQARHLHDLEAKLRIAHTETSGLREQMSVLKGQMLTLQKNLDEERESKASALREMALSFQKQMMAGAICFFAAGGILTGSLSWYVASVRAEAKHAVQTTAKTLEYQLASVRMELYEKEMGRLEKSLEAAEAALIEDRVEKTVAVTKLKIILESLSREKTGFELDFQKLERELNKPVSIAMPGVKEKI